MVSAISPGLLAWQVLLHAIALPYMCRGNGSRPWSMMHLGRWPEPSRSTAQQSRPSGSAVLIQAPVQPQPWTSAPSQVRFPGTTSDAKAQAVSSLVQQQQMPERLQTSGWCGSVGGGWLRTTCAARTQSESSHCPHHLTVPYVRDCLHMRLAHKSAAGQRPFGLQRCLTLCRCNF